MIEPNIRYFVAHQAKGIFMQAAAETTCAELSDLRNYVMGHLLWDPNRSGACWPTNSCDFTTVGRPIRSAGSSTRSNNSLAPAAGIRAVSAAPLNSGSMRNSPRQDWMPSAKP